VPSSGGIGPDPAALDQEWTAYSDRSGCADWAGGDGISVYRIDSSQLAWFFSDTYLGPAGPAIGFSRISGFLHNSVVIQTMTGRDSTFVTMTGGGACRRPGDPTRPGAVSVVASPAAPGASADRYWDADGIEIGGTIVKFYNRFLPDPVPFIPVGTVIASFPVSQLRSAGRGPAYGAVAHPALTVLPTYTPPGAGGPIVWGAALLREGGTVYVYGTQTVDLSTGSRLVYLARVAASRLTDFSAWRFYTGSAQWTSARWTSAQWASGQQDATPIQPESGLSVSTGFSVISAGQRYWLIQSDPAAGSQDIDAYPASAPWGPFDPAAGIVLYRDHSIGLDATHDYRIMYEARVEPALSTGDSLVISYNVNSEAVTSGCVPIAAYTNAMTQPRFITVPMAVFNAPSRVPVQVRAGPSHYPQVVQRDPAQWFDGWAYPSGCPPVPDVANLRARDEPGAVTLSWSAAGLGVRYRVYLLDPGAVGFALAKSTRATSITLSGLGAGSYVAQLVPVNLKLDTGPATEVSFFLS
jgi:hypothetical protein